jgi:hypothetical protein
MIGEIITNYFSVKDSNATKKNSLGVAKNQKS